MRVKPKEEFNPNKLLQPNVILKSIDSHLYTIGLSLFSVENCKRSAFYNPKLIFIIQLQLFIRYFISIIASEENPQLFVFIGDFGYYLKVRFHFAVANCLVTFLGLISQVLHYYNYKNDIKPSYLKPFEMMSGLVSPQSIGLSNEKQIYKMITISKLLFKICKIIPRITSIFALVLSLWTYINNFSFKQLIIFGIPYSILGYCAVM